jgi:hypothetical protein
MSFDDVNREVQSAGSAWVKLTKKSHGMLKGKLVNAETRDQRDMQGEVLKGKKSGVVRTEWVLTLEVDGETKKFSAKESAKTAIKAALDTAGVKSMASGGFLQIVVVEDSVQGKSQATYKAKYTAPVKSEDPWADEPTSAGPDADEPPF